VNTTPLVVVVKGKSTEISEDLTPLIGQLGQIGSLNEGGGQDHSLQRL
jgi:hypothetical protein